MDGRLRPRWVGRLGRELFQQIRSTIPAETPGSLEDSEYYDLTAFILQSGNVAIDDGQISVAELNTLSINPSEAIASASCIRRRLSINTLKMGP